MLRAISIAVLLTPALWAQSPFDTPGITVQAGGVLRHRAPVHYPEDSVAAGTVEVEASLRATGEVSDAHVISGPMELRRSALESVLEWHYSPETVSPVQISIHFNSSSGPPPALVPVPPPWPQNAEDFSSGILKSIDFIGVSPEAEAQLRSRLPIQEGEVVHHSDFDKITASVREFDEHLVTDFSGKIAGPDVHRDLALHIRAAVASAAPPTTVKQ